MNTALKRVAIRSAAWYGSFRRILLLFSPSYRLKVSELKRLKSLKLNLGCGEVRFKGWINIDLALNSDIVMDLRKPLPFKDESVDFVYSEHFIEHITFEESSRLLAEIHRCLKKDAVLRIATPDLDYVIQKYVSADWSNQDWLTLPAYDFIKTRGCMINTSFSAWEHKYLFNEEDLSNALKSAGFKQITRCDLRTSSHKEFQGLETRNDSKLIIEATK